MAGNYFNRDLSWLSFNHRVLQEASNSKVPLFERMKFLAIYTSNLEEFYSIRVAEWKRLSLLTRKTKRVLPENPLEILKKIQHTVKKQQLEFDTIFRTHIIKDLAQAKVILLDDQLNNENQKKYVKKFFRKSLKPILKTIELNSNGIPDELHETSIYLVVRVRSSSSTETGTYVYTLVEIPGDKLGRFITLPASDNRHYVIFLDDVIRCCIQELFPEAAQIESYSIKLTRDADLMLEDEFSGSLLKKIKKGIAVRSQGIPTRLMYDKAMPADLLKFLRTTFNIGQMDLLPGGRYLNLSDLLHFPQPVQKGLLDEKWPCIKPEFSSLFETMEKGDRLLHFPYHCFQPVIDFLKEAADDPNVLSIKITLYRVAKASKVIKALLRALSRGKSVTAFVELKARFNEQSNISYARELEEAGATVLYSFPELKVHAKMICVERMENERLRRYVFLSTGNFNESTANTYVDSGLFTRDKVITKEVAAFFEILNDTRVKREFNQLLVAPDHMRHQLVTLIDQEIKNALKGKPAYILMKLNSLQDQRIIDKLYEAGNEGVKVKLIVRGICCLIPGRKGLSENIRVLSIVDRFLEHNRIFIFANSGQPKVYLSSADLMERNLSRRFEVAFPILNPACAQEIIDIFNIQWSDTVKARVINRMQNNPFRKTKSRLKIRSQEEIYNYLRIN